MGDKSKFSDFLKRSGLKQIRENKTRSGKTYGPTDTPPGQDQTVKI